MKRSESDPVTASESLTISDVSQPARRQTSFLTFRIGKVFAFLFAAIGILFAIGMIFTRPLVDAAYAVAVWSDKPAEKELPAGLTPDEQLMYGLSDLSAPKATEVLDQIVAANDQRFVPVLLELLRMTDSRNLSEMFVGAGLTRHFNALERLTGQELSGTREEMGSVTRRWDLWYQSVEPIEPPAGFVAWKGRLYSIYDADITHFFKNEYPADIPLIDIRYGGGQVGGVPELNDPTTILASQASYLDPNEPVIGIEYNGVTRAYPQRLLDFHDIVNDSLNGVPVTVSYCSLCRSCNAFNTQMEAGSKLTFGTSGLFYNSNKLMFDRQTLSLWNQLTGRPVVGKLLAENVELERIPVTVTRWKNWLDAHPKTEVVSFKTRYEKAYVQGFSDGRFFRRSSRMTVALPNDVRLQKKDFIYGLGTGTSAKAYPISFLIQQPVLHDQFDGKDVVIVTPHGEIQVKSIVPRRRRPGNTTVSYSAGAEVRVYESKGFRFSAGDTPGALFDAEGKSWKATERALVSESGEELPRIAGTQSYWSGWRAFHPQTELFVRSIP